MPRSALLDRDVDRKREQRAQAKTVIVPACADPKRRARLEADDIAWLRYYPMNTDTGKPLFWYDFTAQQTEMIQAIRAAIEHGGDQAIAASRGEGKTSIFEMMLLKYTLSGAVRFAVLLSATGGAAQDSLDAMKEQIECNERLADDYPEICIPVQQLEDTPQRAQYQLVTGTRHDTGEDFVGVSSRFRWCGHELQFPKTPGAPGASAVIATRGLDAAVRGLKKKGRRPEVVCIDDPDTEDSVRSIEQAQKLEERIDRGLAGLGGQQRGVARVMLTTLQRPECVSAWFTDPKRKPSFKGKRFRFMIRKPDRMDLWEQYIEKWRMGSQSGDQFFRAAHQFYLENRDAMDAGAVVANVNRFNSGLCPDGSQVEVSAIQRYYNEVAKIGQDAVSTEYDNDPKDETANADILPADQIVVKVNGYERGLVPRDAQHLTAFIDVQGKLLYWAVCAWRSDFTGYLINYGAWPGQRRAYFTLADAVPTISDVCQGGQEAALYSALEKLTAELCGREWIVDGGTSTKIGRCLIDANWGESTPTVYSFCRQSPHAAVLLPTHGRGVKVSGAPMMQWAVQDGEQVGLNWRIRRTTKKHAPIRHGIYDTNFWKSFMHARLFVPMADSGSLSLFKAEPAAHRMLADQLHAEYPVMVESQGRKVNEWMERANHPDNHFLDCLTGCAVAGSIMGAKLGAHGQTVRKTRVPLAQMGRS